VVPKRFEHLDMPSVTGTMTRFAWFVRQRNPGWTWLVWVSRPGRREEPCLGRCDRHHVEDHCRRVGVLGRRLERQALRRFPTEAETPPVPSRVSSTRNGVAAM